MNSIEDINFDQWKPHSTFKRKWAIIEGNHRLKKFTDARSRRAIIRTSRRREACAKACESDRTPFPVRPALGSPQNAQNLKPENEIKLM